MHYIISGGTKHTTSLNMPLLHLQSSRTNHNDSKSRLYAGPSAGAEVARLRKLHTSCHREQGQPDCGSWLRTNREVHNVSRNRARTQVPPQAQEVPRLRKRHVGRPAGPNATSRAPSQLRQDARRTPIRFPGLAGFRLASRMTSKFMRACAPVRRHLLSNATCLVQPHLFSMA